LELRVGEGAHCLVTTQSSTKIYRSPGGDACTHTTQASISAGALLVFAPDAVQPFGGSAFIQRQVFHLGQGAGLALVDWFTAGRTMRGERWAFRHFHTRNEVFLNEKRVLLDSTMLDPTDGSLDLTHRVGRFNCFATLFLAGPQLRTATKHILAEIGSLPITANATLVSSASSVEDGVILRIAGCGSEDVGSELRARLRPVCALLGDDPFARKW
jgi:urease accessory protein